VAEPSAVATEALLYIDSAVANARRNNNARAETEYLTNKALTLHEMKRYDEAEALYKSCISNNFANQWNDDLAYDYWGISDNYYAKGDYAQAYDYLDKYYTLKDSISGVSVDFKVAGIEATHKSELDKIVAKNELLKRNWVIAVCILVLSFIIWLWLSQSKRAKRKQAHTKANLEQLTHTLIEKNRHLSALEEKLSEQELNSVTYNPVLPEILNENTSRAENGHTGKEKLTIESQPDDFERNLYSQHILTPADWSAFKIYFEKAYPGYLFRLRNTFPALSEAEERLFLFIKLKLTNKEAAAILGISVDSVRKTRIRLRKRLELKEDVNLEEYVVRF